MIVRAYSNTRKTILTSREFDSFAQAEAFALALSLCAAIKPLALVTIEMDDRAIARYRAGEKL